MKNILGNMKMQLGISILLLTIYVIIIAIAVFPFTSLNHDILILSSILGLIAIIIFSISLWEQEFILVGGALVLLVSSLTQLLFEANTIDTSSPSHLLGDWILLGVFLLGIAIIGFGTVEYIIRHRRLQIKTTALHSELGETNYQLTLQRKDASTYLKHTSDLVAKITPGGIIVFANDSFRAMYQTVSNDIINQNILSLNEQIGKFDHEWLSKALQNHFFVGHAKVMVQGTPRWYSWATETIGATADEAEYLLIIGHDISELKLLNNKLEYENTHDTLTGLLNRHGLLAHLGDLGPISDAKCIFIDLENFASVNDFYGHDFGDELLQQVALELQQYEKYGCTIARLSGDEFIILFYQQSNQCETELLNDIYKKYNIKGVEVILKKNMGSASYPGDSHDFARLFSFANLAADFAKKEPQIEITRYQSNMSDSLRSRIQVANKLKGAIEGGAIEIFFQSIVSADDGIIRYVEALARWHDEEMGWVSPEFFLSVAQESGMIFELEALLFRLTFATFAKVQDRNEMKNVILSINITPSNLLQDSFPRLFYEQVNQMGISPSRVCVEISEKTFVNNINLCLEQIRKISDYGFQIALDDFGKEYSSLAVLENMNFDVIKIDRFFVENMENWRSREIIKMIISITQNANKIVIAEGVETSKQSDDLMNLNCCLQQGYYFSKPQRLN